MDLFASPIDRETALRTVVGGGAAMLLAYAMWARATERASPAQVRALAKAAVGFLMSAGASVYLRDRQALGAGVSLAGCVVVLSAMRALVRERLERQEAARRRAAGLPPAGE